MHPHTRSGAHHPTSCLTHILPPSYLLVLCFYTLSLCNNDVLEKFLIQSMNNQMFKDFRFGVSWIQKSSFKKMCVWGFFIIWIYVYITSDQIGNPIFMKFGMFVVKMPISPYSFSFVYFYFSGIYSKNILYRFTNTIFLLKKLL